MVKRVFILSFAAMMLTSCVSKKKYNEVLAAKDNCETKMAKIQSKVDDYFAKINSLTDQNSSLTDQNNSLRIENDSKLEWVEGVTALSKKSKEAMRKTLENVDPAKLAQAKTLEDSLNLAVSYNLKKNLEADPNAQEDDIDINIDETVVMINISDRLLFSSGSARVNKQAYPLLKRLASVINSEPAMEVMVEGHTDNTKIKKSNFKDNWELSTERATAIVRLLENEYGVNGAQMIASGRSSYVPLVENDTWENRSRNRRTRIVILPNLDKFLAMLEGE